MGTRSDIIVHRADGSWKRIYCHWDGYLSHNGEILHQHYTTQKKVEALVAPGDMSSLAARVGSKHPFEWKERVYHLAKTAHPGDFDKQREFEKNHPDTLKYSAMCVYYGRDRGEKDVGGVVGDTLQAVWPPEDTWTEFTYVWDEGKWWVTSSDKGTQSLVLLADALIGKVDVGAQVKVPFLGVVGTHKPEPKADAPAQPVSSGVDVYVVPVRPKRARKAR